MEQLYIVKNIHKADIIGDPHAVMNKLVHCFKAWLIDQRARVDCKSH